jgi:hypothetical protein
MSDIQLSGDAVDALSKILTHAQREGGVVAISSMGPDDWSGIYNFGEEEEGSPMAAGSAITMANNLDDVVIEMAKQVGLI